MSARTEFFTVVPVAEALHRLIEALIPTRPTETIPTDEALHRVLATSPISPINLPAFTRSTMDGFAVRAADTFGASDALPAYLRVVGTAHMGEVPAFSLEPAEAAVIHTGAMLPRGADAVVMIERTQTIGDDVEIMAAVALGENVVQIGEDVAEGAPMLPAGHRLRPQDIGGLLAVGMTRVEVVRPPRVAILSCGDELVPPDADPALSQIRDINAAMLAALVTEAGAVAHRLGIARDTLDSLLPLARQGLADADMLIMSAGSSVSVRDLTREVIDQLGAPGVLQHGIAVKPGKPTIIAVCDNKPVIGLPGNPVSALSVARQLVRPTIHHLLGARPAPPLGVHATLTANIASTTGREDTVPVRLIAGDDGWQAEPIFGKSNLIFTLINADGVVTVPLNSGGLRAGTLVEVYAF
ncbi:MAG: gephyrin-like molybdotransferase Glp [Phototrophicaceae bacterium]